MSFSVRFAPEAEETYNALVDQLRVRWGDEFVIKFELKIVKTIQIIAETPLIYSVAKENSGVRKCVLHKNCSIYYIIDADQIEIVYFWDNRQDPMFIL
jgi:plasmid stabilization system protein ParE